MKKISVPALLVLGALFTVPMATTAGAVDVAAKCAGCHGDSGVSAKGDTPTIAGLSVAYLTETMNSYKSGDRTNCKEVDLKGVKTDMCKIAKDLSDEDIKASSDFYAKKKFVHAKQPVDAALAKKGAEIHDMNCEKCHSEGGSLADDDAGILAGQWKAYLKTEMNDLRSGDRSGSKKMVDKLKGLEPADIDALAEFYAGHK